MAASRSKRFLLLTAVLLFIGGCTGIKDAHTGEAGEAEGAEEQDSAIEELEYENYLLECRAENYRRYFEALIASADQEEYLRLSRNLYRYRLSVEGREFADSGEMVVEDTDFTILLTQEFLDIEGLPEDMSILGHLTNQEGEYNSHLQIDSPVSYNMQPGSGTTVSGYSYCFEHVPAGTVISLTLTPELCERLGLRTRILRITVAEGACTAGNQGSGSGGGNANQCPCTPAAAAGRLLPGSFHQLFQACFGHKIFDVLPGPGHYGAGLFDQLRPFKSRPGEDRFDLLSVGRHEQPQKHNGADSVQNSSALLLGQIPDPSVAAILGPFIENCLRLIRRPSLHILA